MNLRTLTAILLLGNLYIGFSQTHEYPFQEHNPTKLKKLGDKALKFGDVYTALFYYEELVKVDSSNIEAHYKVAELHEATRNYTEAEINFNYIVTKAPKTHPDALYHLALMQKMQGKYDEAKLNFSNYYENLKSRDRDFKRQIQLEIAGCDTANYFNNFPSKGSVANLGNSVNHPHIEFSPLPLNENKLVFGTLREDTLHFYHINFEDKEPLPHRKLMLATKEGNTWIENGLFENFNDLEMEMGKITYSHNSKTYYLTKCISDIHHKTECHLYEAKNTKKGISEVTKLPEPVNIHGFSSTQPTVRFDTLRKRDILYFVSDRPGGKGGKDIWYTYYDQRKKTWKKPNNLRLLNTPNSETTPYYDNQKDDLYFSSDGHATIGGFDVFKSEIRDGRYSTPINVGIPINSSADDLDFIFDINTDKTGYLVSNRKGGHAYFHETCCDDIYSFSIEDIKPYKSELQIRIEDTSCKEYTISFSSTDLKTNTTTNDSLSITDCNSIHKLNPHTNYSFICSRKGFFNDTLTLFTSNETIEEIIQKSFKLKPIPAPTPIVKDTTPTPVMTAEVFEKLSESEAPIVLKDVQYEYNSTKLTPVSKAALKSGLVPYMLKHTEIKVVIASYTDSKGSEEYNKNLSQLRAQNVVDYLVEMGVNKNMLKAIGHGENNPIEPNEMPDGTDNPEGRKANRRTEFIINK